VSSVDLEAALRVYGERFEGLRPDTLDELAECLAPDVRFKDPFNRVRGIDACLRVFRHMFATLIEPRFHVRHRALAGDIGYLHWVFEFRTSGASALRRIDGLSQIRLDPQGRVLAHVDYWDPAEQLYADVPVLGWVLGRVRERLGA
jgi:hypothetical protein